MSVKCSGFSMTASFDIVVLRYLAIFFFCDIAVFGNFYAVLRCSEPPNAPSLSELSVYFAKCLKPSRLWFVLLLLLLLLFSLFLSWFKIQMKSLDLEATREPVEMPRVHKVIALTEVNPELLFLPKKSKFCVPRFSVYLQYPNVDFTFQTCSNF